MILIAVKTISVAATLGSGGKTGLELFQKSIPRELKAAYKAPFPGLVFILPHSELALGE